MKKLPVLKLVLFLLFLNTKIQALNVEQAFSFLQTKSQTFKTNIDDNNWILPIVGTIWVAAIICFVLEKCRKNKKQYKNFKKPKPVKQITQVTL
ncbi:MAG: hypothetical protein P4L22_00230 [Candidatus Babeliales bacterium]|nr:hypothetical protein [Candidatus Babeliales bacterium]